MRCRKSRVHVWPPHVQPLAPPHSFVSNNNVFAMPSPVFWTSEFPRKLFGPFRFIVGLFSLELVQQHFTSKSSAIQKRKQDGLVAMCYASQELVQSLHSPRARSRERPPRPAKPASPSPSLLARLLQINLPLRLGHVGPFILPRRSLGPQDRVVAWVEGRGAERLRAEP